MWLINFITYLNNCISELDHIHTSEVRPKYQNPVFLIVPGLDAKHWFSKMQVENSEPQLTGWPCDTSLRFMMRKAVTQNSLNP